MLSLDVAAAATGNQLRISWGGSIIATINPSQVSWTSYTYTITAGANAAANTLLLEEIGTNDTSGTFIDNVRITDRINVNENAVAGTVVANLGTSDPDSPMNDQHTYSIISGDSTNFEIVGNQLRVKAGATLNRENHVSRSVTIRTTDVSGSTFDQAFTVFLNDLNEFAVGAITDSNATANSVAENATNGTVVGITASATDADATNNTITYSLDNNAGGRFTIDASTGIVTVANGSLLNFEAATSHTITVRAASNDNSFSTQSFVVNLTNVNEGPFAVVDTATAVEAGGVSNGTVGSNPTGNVLTNDTDVDAGDTKTVTGVLAGVQASAAANVGSAVTGSFGSITIAADGAYTYTVDNSNSAVQALRTTSNTLQDVFTYTMRDTSGLTSTTQITVTIQGANDAPTAVADTVTAVEAGGVANGTAGTNPTGNVLTNDTDPDSAGNGETKTVVGVLAGTQASAAGNVGLYVAGQYGAVIVNPNGSYQYLVNNSDASVQALRNSGNSLTDTFTYTMTDAGGQTSTAQLTVTITGQNDAPVMVYGAGTTPVSNLLANGSFETSTLSTLMDTNSGGRLWIGSGLNGWTASNFSVVDANIYGTNIGASDGLRGIVLTNGTSNGSISQSIAGLVSGTSYQLSFDSHRSGDGSSPSVLEIRWNGSVVGTVTTNVQASWTTSSLNVTAASGTNTLTINEIGTGGAQWWRTYLDNVVLSNTPVALTVAENSANGTVIDTLSTLDRIPATPLLTH